MNNRLFLTVLVFVVIHINTLHGQTSDFLRRKIKNTNGLVALWDFREKEGQFRKAIGKGKFQLKEMDGTIPRVDEGPISGYSALFGNKAYLCIPNKKTGKLNIYGEKQGITVMAWIKWKGNIGFVGGMWNEYQDGGKRQYGLFVSLPYYNGADQVCGHISKTGKPTPPFPYSIDYSASKGIVQKDEWQFVAFTYDGKWIKSFLNGKFEERGEELVDHTVGFENYPQGLIQSKNPYFFPDGIGNNGSDFTVGAVFLKAGMGNFFVGQIGGLAVFNRALAEEEIKSFNLGH